jgi:hypothetical protein
VAFYATFLDYRNFAAVHIRLKTSQEALQMTL